MISDCSRHLGGREGEGRTDTEVEVATAVVRYELHRVARHNIFGIHAHEI